MEARNPGFLWYTVVDNHLLNAALRRHFPDEGLPLGAVEFLGNTAAGFFPWVLTLPQALSDVARDRPRDARGRVTALLAGWGIAVVAFFTLSLFRLAHYGLPAFPAFALLTGKAWDDLMRRSRTEVGPSQFLPGAGLLAAGGIALGLALSGRLPGQRLLVFTDVYSRTLLARGQVPAFIATSDQHALLIQIGIALLCGGLGVAAAAAWRRPWLGAVAVAGAMILVLHGVNQGLYLFATARSIKPMTQLLMREAGPEDRVVHEGPLDDSGALPFYAGRQVAIVNGHESTLAFGSTFPDSRATFLDTDELIARWAEPGRLFLVTTYPPGQSVVDRLPPGRVHLLLEGGGRWLYSNMEAE